MVGTGNPLFFNFFFFFLQVHQWNPVKDEKKNKEWVRTGKCIPTGINSFTLFLPIFTRTQTTAIKHNHPPPGSVHPHAMARVSPGRWQSLAPQSPQFLTILWDQPAPPAAPGQPQLGTALLSSFPRAACELGCGFLHAGGTEEASGEQWEWLRGLGVPYCTLLSPQCVFQSVIYCW